MATDKNINGFMGILAAAFPNFNLTQETIIVYQRTLADIDDKVLENAVIDLITKNKWFPTVSEIRDASFAIMANKANLPSVYEAFEESYRAKPEHTNRCEFDGDKYIVQTEPYKWSHPLVEKAARLMGWPDNFPGDNINVDRAQFTKVYETLLSRAELDVKTLPQVKQFAENYQIDNGIKAIAEKLRMEE